VVLKLLKLLFGKGDLKVPPRANEDSYLISFDTWFYGVRGDGITGESDWIEFFCLSIPPDLRYSEANKGAIV